MLQWVAVSSGHELLPLPTGGPRARAREQLTKGDILARPNHQFEKRQRELAKQKKIEEMRRRKLERSSGTSKDEAPLPSENAVSEEPTA